MIRDVFLCHASEDKKSIVRSLYEGLTKAGITCWLDEAEVSWGDSIVEKVQEGLRESQFVIVVLSKAFLAKPWPRRELAAALSVEASTGGVRVLPLLAGDEQERRAALVELPLLADKLHLIWDGDLTRVVEAMQQRLKKPDIAKTPAQLQRKQVSKIGVKYCLRCGAKTGNPTQCPGFQNHQFAQGTGKEYCLRCGAVAGNPTKCPGYQNHQFAQGTGNEYCLLCGAVTGNPTECPGYQNHTFAKGTGNEYCLRCGAAVGNPTKCPGYQNHAFAQG